MTMVDGVLQRARLATFSYFALNGFVLGMWIVNIPEIRDRTDVSTEQLGYLILLMGGGAFAGMQVAGRVIDHLGSGRVATLSGVALCVTLLGPAFATSAWTLGLALVTLGLANGFVDISQNSHAVEIETGYGRPILSSFHAFFSFGGLFASLVGGTLISLDVDLRWALGLSATAGIASCVTARPHLLAQVHRPPESRTPAPRGSAGWTPRVVLIALLAFALFLSEGVAYDWSTVHLHDSLGAEKNVAAWAFGAFSIAMTAVRLLADRVVARIGSAAYVQRAALIGAIGMTGAALAPVTWFAIVSWAVFGVGLAGCIPQFFSAAGRIDPDNAGLYMARVTSLGYLGLLAGPAIIGILTRWIPLTTALFVPAIGCLLAVVLARRALEPA